VHAGQSAETDADADDDVFEDLEEETSHISHAATLV
jgi:hypothetical protein